jgi:hypothetical protein
MWGCAADPVGDEASALLNRDKPVRIPTPHRKLDVTEPQQETESFRDHLPDDLAALTASDGVSRFLIFVEQLEVACALLADGGIAQARAALVGVDNLANLLLNAHAKAVFASGEGSRCYSRKRFSKKERRKILGDFDRMVTLATRDTDGPSWRRRAAILAEEDAGVMRVAHTYRNNVYHEDRHNEAILGPLTVLYAQAVGRALIASHADSWSYSVDDEQAERLRRLGYEARPDSFVTSCTMLDFQAAARDITAALTGRFEVDDRALRVWLSGDIIDRCARCARIVAGLMQDGMPAERLNWVFFWSQFWAEHGADEQWLELEDERDRLGDELESGNVKTDSNDPRAVAYREAAEAYIARAHALQEAFKPAVRSGDSVRLARAGERLLTAKDRASVLARYSTIDRDVERLEGAMLRAARAWDHMVEAEVDRIREQSRRAGRESRVGAGLGRCRPRRAFESSLL